MRKEIKAWVILMYLVSGVLLMQTIPTFYYMLTPMSRWITYTSVEPARPQFYVGEELRFISVIEARTKCSLEFNDIVFCRPEGGGDFIRYSEQSTHNLSTGPYERKRVPWPYLPGVSYETTCYLESNILLKLPLDFDKHVQLIGAEFEIKGDS